MIIEICRRPPGDLYIRLVELATGVPYPTYLIRAAAGMDCSDLAQQDPIGYFTRHCIMAEKSGRLADIVIAPEIRHNIVEEMLWWESGQIVNDVLTQKFGIVFLKFETREEMLTKTQNMQELIKAVLH